MVNLKKQDPDLKWPDILESWESLTAGAMQLLKGTSIYIVGDSNEINEKVARELAVGLGYEAISAITFRCIRGYPSRKLIKQSIYQNLKQNHACISFSLVYSAGGTCSYSLLKSN